MLTVSLELCEYRKARKSLVLSSEPFAGRFPKQFMVRSHHTGKEVRFVAINEYDVLFDQDQWDGEQMIYRPVGNVSTVDYAVVHHQW
jgi:hypothetical protein